MTDDTLSADRAEATPDELAKFHDGMEGASMVALWERHTNHRENFASSEPPHIWHWREVEPLIEQAVQVTDLEQSERRVIQMHNPAYAIENFCTTKNINCGLQIIMPGERARPHRHNINALRFALEGEGAVTVVDGKRCSMMRGDMILTPGWTWHEHVHEGDEHEGDERVVWLDCLDSPVIDYLGVRFFEPGPAKDFPVLAPDSTFNAPGFAPECEIGDLPYSPMFRYSWAAASQAFDAMPAAADGSRRLHYTNPVTGGAVMTLLDCYLIRLGKNQPTVPFRTTANAVCMVVEGEGVTDVGETRQAWGRNDLFTLPHWNWVRHRASTSDATLFMITDREVLGRLDMLREETGE